VGVWLGIGKGVSLGMSGVELNDVVVASSGSTTGSVPKMIGVVVKACVGGGALIWSSNGEGITPVIINTANPRIMTKNIAAPAPPQPDFFFSGSVRRTAMGRFWTG
jgi:hypothetical protein